MSDFLDLPVPASLREMGVTAAAVFLVSFSDDQKIVEVEVALKTDNRLSEKTLDDVYALALRVYKRPIAKLFHRILNSTRLDGATLMVNAAAYGEKEGA